MVKKEIMNDMEAGLKKIFQEFLREIEKLKNEMSKERKIWREEWNRARKEDRKEREEWKLKRMKLEKRINKLEEREERRERESGRNNIVIKGAKWKEAGTQKVKEFLKESLKLDVEVKNHGK